MEPDVAIVMPAFNSMNTIEKSIISVLNQRYRNFELIIVDDNSTDATKEIVNGFYDERIVLLENEFTKGAAGARKTAIEYTSCRYIAFLDSDDIWDESKLLNQLDFMKSNDFAFTYTSYFVFKGSIENKLKEIRPPEKLSYDDLIKYCSIGCLTVIYDTFKFSHLSYDNVPKEDYAYWLKLLKQVKFAYKCPNSISFYRIGDTSLSGNKFKEFKKQWYILREVENISLSYSLYCILRYGINGVLKHFL